MVQRRPATLSPDHGGVCSDNLQLTVIHRIRNPSHIYIYILIRARQHMRYYCLYRSLTCLEFFNTLVFWPTFTDSSHFFAVTVGLAQTTMIVRRRPAARSLAMTVECVVFRSVVKLYNQPFVR